MTPSILPVVTAIQAQWAKDLRAGAKMPKGTAKPQDRCARLKVRTKLKK